MKSGGGGWRLLKILYTANEVIAAGLLRRIAMIIITAAVRLPCDVNSYSLSLGMFYGDRLVAG